MKREWVAFLLFIPLIFLYAFYPEKSPVEAVKNDVTIHDDFFTLLGRQTTVWKSYVRENDIEGMEQYRVLYEKNKNLQFESGPNFRIPKTIHFIWLGPSNFPRESVENVRTWIAHHPDWTVKFWTDRKRVAPCASMEVHNVNEFPFMKLKDQYYEAKNWAEKSDILRYEILFQEGGVYVDHDANCLRPFHGLHKGYDFYACLELPHPEVDSMTITAGIGIIGARPRHPVLKGCIETVEKRWHKISKAFSYNDPESRRELVLHRTYISMTHSLKENVDKPGNYDIVFPASYFYAKGPLPSLYSQHFYGGKWEQKAKKSNTKLFSSLPKILRETRISTKRIIKLQIFTVAILLGCFGILFKLRRSLFYLSLFVLFCGRVSYAQQDEFVHLMGESNHSLTHLITPEDFQNFDFFKEGYEQNKALLDASADRIPRIIHFVWLGPSSLPSSSIKNIASWIKKHPHWECYLWTDRIRSGLHELPGLKQKLVKDFTFSQLGKCFVTANTYREKADVLRYELLYQFGGVVIDHDVACHRTFAPFNKSYDFYASLQPLRNATLSSSVVVSNSIMGAKPHHPIMRLCLALVDDKWQQGMQYFPREDKESNIYRVFYRIFAPFDYAVKARINHKANRDIVFPVGYFYKIENDFGIYADHKYGVTWFDGETKAERELRSRVDGLSRKQDQLLMVTLVILVFALILFGSLLVVNRRMVKR